MIARRRPLAADTKLPILIPLVTLVLLAGCAKNPAVAPAASVPIASAAPTQAAPRAVSHSAVRPEAAAPAPASKAPGATAPDAPAHRPRPSEFGAVSALEDIHFDFDKYAIRRADARILDENARWMKANHGSTILIEGHADERGTNEYNLALGDRRAKATMSYLVAQGVQASRIILISYGEERPLCKERNEGCWAKNRRAHFLARRQ